MPSLRQRFVLELFGFEKQNCILVKLGLGDDVELDPNFSPGSNISKQEVLFKVEINTRTSSLPPLPFHAPPPGGFCCCCRPLFVVWYVHGHFCPDVVLDFDEDTCGLS